MAPAMPYNKEFVVAVMTTVAKPKSYMARCELCSTKRNAAAGKITTAHKKLQRLSQQQEKVKFRQLHTKTSED